jgi:release factor glutamine methyltransferase
MAEQEEWSVGRLLTWTTDYLKKNGSDSPRLEAEVLLAHARGCQRIELYTAFNDLVQPEIRTKFRELIKRRSEGAPVAYLVGEREFFSLSFKVSPSVLIPRPETETLVVLALTYLQSLPAAAGPPRVVDVGTGSGAIVIALAKHFPAAEYHAIDVSTEALEIAKENAAKHGLSDKIAFAQGDLLSGQPANAFDLVVSNPPYVSEPEYAALPRDVKDHEPKLALVGGPKGDELLQKLVGQAATCLKPGGRILMEISPMLEGAAVAFLQGQNAFEQVGAQKDLAQLTRVVGASRKPGA